MYGHIWKNKSAYNLIHHERNYNVMEVDTELLLITGIRDSIILLKVALQTALILHRFNMLLQ